MFAFASPRLFVSLCLGVCLLKCIRTGALFNSFAHPYKMLEFGPHDMPFTGLAALEICSGAGGQASGLEAAGFGLAAVVEIDSHACRTLRANQPHWHVIETDVREINGRDFGSGAV